MKLNVDIKDCGVNESNEMLFSAKIIVNDYEFKLPKMSKEDLLMLAFLIKSHFGEQYKGFLSQLF